MSLKYGAFSHYLPAPTYELKTTVTVQLPHGLHGRPSTTIVQSIEPIYRLLSLTLSRQITFICDIENQNTKQKASLRSISQMFTAEISQGTPVLVYFAIKLNTENTLHQAIINIPNRLSEIEDLLERICAE